MEDPMLHIAAKKYKEYPMVLKLMVTGACKELFPAQKIM